MHVVNLGIGQTHAGSALDLLLGLRRWAAPDP